MVAESRAVMLQLSTPEYYRVCHASVYKEQMRSSIPDSRHGWTIGNKEDTASHLKSIHQDDTWETLHSLHW